MAYLGRGIENLSDRVVLDSLTASATASYTLQLNSVNFVPSSASSLTLSLNGVIQKPDSSYTVSGSTLTFSSALTSSDSIDFIIAERGITLQTPSAGSVGTSQLSSTLDLSSKTITLASNMTNTPYFYGELASNQTLTRNTDTKITGLTQNELDSATAFDGTTFTVPSGQSGKYYLEGVITGSYADIGRDGEKTVSYIYKNGSAIKTAVIRQGDTGQNQREITTVASGIFNLSASDTIELYGNLTDANASGSGFVSASKTSLMGYKLIGD